MIADIPTTGRIGRVVQALGDGAVIARRNLTHVRHVPEKLLDVTFQPLIFVLLFSYVFGSAIKVPGVSYREYLMGGIFVQTVAFASMNTAISVADDMHKGVIERFRALPMARSAVLLGRTGADLASSVIALTVLAVTGFATGWRIHSSVWEAIAGFVLLLLFGYSMTWMGTLIGLSVRAPEAAQSIGFMVLFPLTFVANTFVPTEGMPRWLQVFAEWNPISSLATGCRELFGNQPPGSQPTVWPLEHAIFVSFAWSFVIIAVCLPLAVRRYRTAYGR
jgi:ABC-2 type transport system permease protein